MSQNFAENWKKLNTSSLSKTSFDSHLKQNIQILKTLQNILINAVSELYGTSEKNDKYKKIVDLILLRINGIISEKDLSLDFVYQNIESTINDFLKNNIVNNSSSINISNDKNIDNNAKHNNIRNLLNCIVDNLTNISIDNKKTKNLKQSSNKTTFKNKKESLNLNILDKLNFNLKRLNNYCDITYVLQNFILKTFSNNVFLKSINISKSTINQLKFNLIFISTINEEFIYNCNLNYNKIYDKYVQYLNLINTNNISNYKIFKKAFRRKSIFEKIFDKINDNSIVKKHVLKLFGNKNSFLSMFFKNIFSNTLSNLYDYIYEHVIQNIKKIITNFFNKCKQFINTIKNTLYNILKIIKKLLIKSISSIVSFFGKAISKSWKAIKALLKLIYTTAIAAVKGIIALVKIGCTTLGNWFSKTNTGSKIKDIWNASKSWLGKKTSKLKNLMPKRFSNVINSIKNSFSKIKNIKNNLVNGIKNGYKTIKNKIQQQLSNVVKIIKNKISNVCKTIINSVKRKIGPVIAKIFRKKAGKKLGKTAGRKLIITAIKWLAKKIFTKAVGKIITGILTSFLSGGIGLAISIITILIDIYMMLNDKEIQAMLPGLKEYCSFEMINNMIVDFVNEVKEKLKNAVKNMIAAGLKWFNEYISKTVKVCTQGICKVVDFFSGTKKINTSKYQDDINKILKEKSDIFKSKTVNEKLKFLNTFNFKDIQHFILEIERLTKLIDEESNSWFPSTKEINKLINLRQDLFISLAKKIGQYGVTELNENNVKNLPFKILKLKQSLQLAYKEEAIILEMSLENKLNNLEELSKEFVNIRNNNINDFSKNLEEVKEFIIKQYKKYSIKFLTLNTALNFV